MSVVLIRCAPDGMPVTPVAVLPEEGFAGQTAAALVAIARAHDPAVKLKAFTLMEENPSVRVLRRLGFALVGTAQDADAGEVWEWRA